MECFLIEASLNGSCLRVARIRFVLPDVLSPTVQDCIQFLYIVDAPLIASAIRSTIGLSEAKSLIKLPANS